MGKIRRSRTHKGIRDHYRKTRNNVKDLDQVHEELRRLEEKICIDEQGSGGNVVPDEDQASDLELPGSGKYPCIPCARYFINSDALKEHQRGKVHKKRIKLLKEAPYTQTEAEAAVGYSTENSRVKMMNDFP
ncbi:18889_t:CDS:2 [Acaulospora morrowiae]|uniref:18889_t:CDS:1 n=1 Tax=Acaulospora morrowiae TaxID=94023 RepID=A0A9N9HTZ8_9GLOM|nr:18889_t:CDS:2 [Acaulospora morrowiae]